MFYLVYNQIFTTMLKFKGFLFFIVFISLVLIFSSSSCKKDDKPIIGSVEDSQGNVYLTVETESQEWMKENLIVTEYNNGDEIPQVQDDEEWANLETGAWCYYNHESGETYGKLYNWYAVQDKRGICPDGWKVPTDNDWTVLVNEFNGINLAGGSLKSVHTVPDEHPRWINPNVNASDESGFSATPGGFRNHEGMFQHLGSFGGWWTSSKEYNENAWKFGLSYNDEKVHNYPRNKKYGFSVRCVRETEDLEREEVEEEENDE